jgi:UDP-N-acetylmuramoyl-tripeptide--D-alanyl-D-alanine ligase
VLATTLEIVVCLVIVQPLLSHQLLALLVFLFVLIVFQYFYFIFLVLATLVLWPFDAAAKELIVSRAKEKVKKLPNLKIIGIAGSYGKTTMKEILATVLKVKLQTLATPESVNTPLGIARWILKNVSPSTEVAVVEMGEHYPGDIAELCRITQPDIAVVTGINEAHMERMKTLDQITSTIFEIVTHAKSNALVLINKDDKRVLEQYKKFVGSKQIVRNYTALHVSAATFDTEKLVWHFAYEGLGEVESHLLGQYALGDIDAAIHIARKFGLDDQQIRVGIANIQPVEHRLQPVRGAAGMLIIDDAYNGNPDGAAEAIRLLSRFTHRRKVYITPGLVEMGSNTARVHTVIGQQLAKVADVVILIKNSVTPYIESGILNFESGKVKPQVIWFDRAEQAHAALKDVLQPNDVIVFQNDWGDQYL